MGDDIPLNNDDHKITWKGIADRSGNRDGHLLHEIEGEGS